MKTAIQQLIIELDAATRNHFQPTVEVSLVISMLHSKLRIEEEQIKDAFVSGDERGTKDIPFNAEQYYSQTFKL